MEYFEIIILSALWKTIINKYYEGKDQAAQAVLSPTVTDTIWAAIGRILIQGNRQVDYLPRKFATASLLFGIHNGDALSETCLLKSWLASLGGFDRHLMGET